MRTVKDVLTEAIAAIEERGWTKGKYVDDNGCLCSVGAVNLAVHGDPETDHCDDDGLYERAMSFLTENADGFGVWEYNDDDDTYLDDVRSMFRHAIASAA